MIAAQRVQAPSCENKIRDAKATKRKLVEAALAAFSTRGYEASSTRSIEAAAGVKRGLIAYHFGSKAQLWTAAADYLMSTTEHDLGEALASLNEADEAARLRLFVRAYVAFCARYPELNRLMIQEGMDRDWRLNWLLERSVRPWYGHVCRIFDQAAELGVAPNFEAHHFYYIVTGAATLMFSNAAEAEALSGRNPLDPAMVDAHADALANLFNSPGDPL